MTRTKGLLGLATALLVAAPSTADQVLTIAHHTDELSMMGQTTPAQDATHTYWFADDATRQDMGDTSVILRLQEKKLYFLDHAEKSYAELDLPIDFEKLVGPEMAPMMEQMSKMMSATVEITPTDRGGEFAGYSCTFSTVEISMSMMQMTSDSCISKDLPIDYSRYQALAEAQAEMLPNQDWMKEMTDKLQGFPVRTDTTTTVMGNDTKSWQELRSVEERDAPAGHYEPPTEYQKVEYNPMEEMQPGRP